MTKALCAEGYYCPGGDKWPTHKTNFCPTGYKCPEGSSDKTGCSPGTYQFNKIQGKCLDCPPGYFCDTALQARANPHMSFVSDNKCPTGHWCETNTQTSTQNKCPPGTYNPKEGAREKSACIPAPPGFYIDVAGANSLDINKVCNAGHYCMLGSYRADPDGTTPTTFGGYNVLYRTIGGQCSDGHYCPQGAPKQI